MWDRGIKGMWYVFVNSVKQKCHVSAEEKPDNCETQMEAPLKKVCWFYIWSIKSLNSSGNKLCKQTVNRQTRPLPSRLGNENAVLQVLTRIGSQHITWSRTCVILRRGVTYRYINRIINNQTPVYWLQKSPCSSWCFFVPPKVIVCCTESGMQIRRARVLQWNNNPYHYHSANSDTILQRIKTKRENVLLLRLHKECLNEFWSDTTWEHEHGFLLLKTFRVLH